MLDASGAAGCEPAAGFCGEGYTDAGEPDFVSAAEQPLSTLSADADTASYANLRRLVRSGAGLGTIDPGAVRIEEMLNYFDYDYAAPAEGEDFALTARAGACPWNAESELVVLGLTVGQAVTEAPPTNLVLLVDVSGSMGDAEKLPLLKESMARIVKGLRAEDRVSIVTYSGVEEVVLKGASGDDAEAILGAINGLEAAGSTNGEAGLSMAYRVAEETHIEGGVNRIVMASDGDLNVGISSEDELNAFVSEKRGQGTYLSVLGFGSGNYQDAKMETLADHGNGSYHYIDSADEAARVYERFLAAGAVPVADDVKLQVEFDPRMVESYRLIGYANRTMADGDFRNDGADAGELCAGAELTVAYEVVLTDEGRRREGDEPWLTCAVRHQPAGERAGEAPAEQRFAVGRESWSAEPGDDWSLAAAVVEFGMLARDSEFVGTATADDAAALAESSASSLDATDRAARRELTDLIRQAQRNAAFDGVVAAS
ncbi:vWA domain-containing protein [Adlercreutzia equolifaciens]|uniref:vWA domain-containing protein n=2 Tax=Adlercreutzia equolifaciens TaxID=446660 RepID=UPI0026DAF18E|nr:von Willebrand factor type A domain-containing protein [Adlercreutzia equolifaciens]